MNDPNSDPETPFFVARFTDHFGGQPSKLPVVTEWLAAFQLPNLQLALNGILPEIEAGVNVVGVVPTESYSLPSLARLSRPRSSAGFEDGPIVYKDVQLADDERLGCIANAVFFLNDGECRAVLLVYSVPERYDDLLLEVMSPDRDHAELLLREVVKRARSGEAFRGKVLSVSQNCDRVSVGFHKLPQIERAAVILPDKLLEQIERQTLSFNKHAARLKAAGRHLKRGLLLYGPPGTGKTLTAMYLASQMRDRTVMLVTAGSIDAIQSVCLLAKALTPATIILEDVDLIGQERDEQTVGANAVLFELLNQMDGLSEDSDILFILTTNHPETLEAALVARPGRIDHALEVPSPDEDCRRRLFELYKRGLHVDVEDWSVILRRTEGVSAAFIREILRKAAVYAAEDSDEVLVVTNRHLDEAITDLLFSMNPLLRRVLGIKSDES